MSLCTSQRRRRYVSNETPNNVSVVRLHAVLLECGDDVSRGRYDDFPSVRLHNVSNKSQMKHPTRLSGTLPRCLSVMYPCGPISTSLRGLLKLPNETPSNVAVVRLHHTLKLYCRDALSLLPSLLRFRITLS